MGKIKDYLLPLNLIEIVYSLAFALMCIIDRHIVNEPAEKTSILTTYITAFEVIDIFLLPIIGILVYVLLQLIKFGISRIDASRFVVIKSDDTTMLRRKSIGLFLLLILIIAIAWTPYLMSYWPGGVYNDTFDSISIALGRQEWDNQNTVLYALFWRLIFWMGEAVNQGDYGGLKLMTIVQPLIMIVVVAGFLTWLKKRGVRNWIIVVATLIYAFMPIFPLYAISLWKDTIFSVNIFLYSWLLYVIIHNIKEKNGDAAGNKILILLAVMSALIIFGRNNGIYIVILSSLVLVVTLRKSIKKERIIRLIACLLSVILLSMLIKGPVYNSLGIKQADKVEQYGIPLQQVGYMISAAANMSEGEKEVIEGIMPVEAWINLYNPIVVDTMKFDPLFNRNYFDAHTSEFLKAYISMVAKNPLLAVKGYLLATLGFWDIWQSSSSAYVCTEHCWNSGYFMSDYFNVHTGLVLADIVGPKWYISAGSLAWIMLGTLIIMMNKRGKREYICVLLPTLSLWLTLMIATPLAFSFRYVFSLLLCIPIYMMLLSKKS